MMDGAALIRSDLSDAIAAYSHFLNGKGKAKTFSYERYVGSDESGRLTLRNAILDAQDAAIKLWQQCGEPKSFSFTGPAIPCGSVLQATAISAVPFHIQQQKIGKKQLGHIPYG